MKRKLSLLQAYNRGNSELFANYCKENCDIVSVSEEKTIYRTRNKKAIWQYAAIYPQKKWLTKWSISKTLQEIE